MRGAIAAIAEDAWVPVAYPQAIYDEDGGQWISDAEIAETSYIVFPSRRKSERITLWLIVWRVKDKIIVPGQGELFTAWRYHAFITDSTLGLVAAEKQHRQHAIIEQVYADLKDSALAHLPWRIVRRERGLVGAGGDRPQPHPRRRVPGQPVPRHSADRHLVAHLITVPARIARGSRRITLHLPLHGPHRDAFSGLFTATHAPPHPA